MPGLPLTRAGLSIAAAGLVDELEMNAAWVAARKGRRAAVGLAISFPSVVVHPTVLSTL